MGRRSDMRKILTLVTLSVTLLVAQSAYALSDTCQKAVGAEHYQDIVKDCLADANSGNAEAQFRIGLLYLKGRGVPRNEKLALEWLQKSADSGFLRSIFVIGMMHQKGLAELKQNNQEALKWLEKAANFGDIAAQMYLGSIYYYGERIEKNIPEAVKWYRLAAEQNFATAQYLLGLFYAVGKGVLQDYKTAREWYQKAAEQGNADAQGRLGAMYQLGMGVQVDSNKAVEWWQKAAEQGHIKAQTSLGLIYEAGAGVSRSVEQGYMWLTIVAKNDFAPAIREQKRVAAKLTPAQITEAERRAAQWLEEHGRKEE